MAPEPPTAPDMLDRLRLISPRRWLLCLTLMLAGLALPWALGLTAAGVGLGAALCTVAVLALASQAAGAVDGWFLRVQPVPVPLPGAAPAGSAAAASPSTFSADNPAYDRLVAYFAAGVRAYRSPCCARVLHPGVPGTRGVRVEGLEGFARTAPLLAAWVRHRGRAILLADGSNFDALDHLVRGITAGTDPAHPEFWGMPQDLDQRIVEASDIALTLWILREPLRQQLSGPARQAAMDWLRQAARRRTYGGNWQLFQLIIGLARECWGEPAEPATRNHYLGFRRCHVGQGWFTDGLDGRIDFYGAWQMQYLLPLAAQMDPTLDTDFLHQRLRDFSASFIHFFGPAGFPIFGRSACYRMALPAPLVLATALPADPFPAASARRALDVIWQHFGTDLCLRGGTVTQGYEHPQPDLLENYAGRSSCLWALRSLVAAYLQPPDAPIWTAAPGRLPVETADYDITIAPAHLRVVGERASGVVTVHLLRNSGQDAPAFQPMDPWRSMAQWLLRRPLRPSNYGAKYGRPSYRSDRPFCD